MAQINTMELVDDQSGPWSPNVGKKRKEPI